MKYPIFLFFALGTPLFAAPRLHVSEAPIQTQTKIEVILDHAACEAENIGKKSSEQWLKIEPEWKGHTTWREANVLSFHPEEAPKLGVEYKFSLVGSHTHLDGSPVPEGLLDTVATVSPTISRSALLARYEAEWSPRTAVHYLIFNAELDPEAAAPFLHFADKNGRRVAARVHRPTLGELNNYRYTLPTFEQAYQLSLDKKPYEQPTDLNHSITNALWVEPASPLPVGDEWKLVALKGLPVGNQTIAETTRHRIGDIDRFKINNAYGLTLVNQPRSVVVEFSRNLPKELPAEFIKVQPEVKGLKLAGEGRRLVIKGDFNDFDKWRIQVDGTLSSYDGLLLGETQTKQIEFEHLEPELGLASQDETQLASGSRYYPVSTVNLESVRIRVKQLKGQQLVRAQQGYRYYTERDQWDESFGPQRLIPYEMMFGKTIADFEVELDNEIDTSKEFYLDWNGILAGNKAPYVLGELPDEPRASGSNDPAALFVEIIGKPKGGAKPHKQRAVQSIVQLTDLGMAWKIQNDALNAYVFSCLTGEPLEGVRIDVFGEDVETMGSFFTDAQGIARLPRNADMRHLKASKGADQFIAPYDDNLPTVGLWSFPVRYSWYDVPMEQRRVMLFTDRSLYRPGEEVHLKGLVRLQNGNAIELQESTTVRLSVTNPMNTKIVTQDIKISAAGSFDHSFRLPAETTGPHQITVTWQEEHEAASKIEGWYDRHQALANAAASIPLRVEEFRRNAFEISHDAGKVEAGDEEVRLKIEAKNYNGQPLDDAEVQIWSRSEERNFYPKKFRDHLFGDHRSPDSDYWYHYFGYRWDDSSGSRRQDSETAELKLNKKGMATFKAKVPKGDFPMLQQIVIQTEITDSNRQTLTHSSTTRVHPASMYLGVSRMDKLVRVGDELPLDLIVVSTQGEQHQEKIKVTAKLSREVNEQVRIQTQHGGAVRNEKREEELSSEKLILEQGAGTYLFKPTNAGRHILEIRGEDKDGHEFATAVTLHVYGSKEYPWAYEDSMRINLVAEKKLYQPGDTARILVLSPIAGTALVSVEREGVSRSFTLPLDPASPVIEIPVGDDDAPNCFVSVLVIKGAEASQRKFKEPQLRLGYCELMVENRRDKLDVEITSVRGDYSADPEEGKPVSVLPGSKLLIEGRVLDSDGKAAAGAEVTVYAVDEGTLAVVGYDTPNPMNFFYAPRQLRVKSGTSLGNFIPESPDEMAFINKGMFIGGGGEEGEGPLNAPRRDFNPCAFWMPTVTVDSKGGFQVEATLPDTLTRYRLIAVVHQNAARFGHVEDAFLVNKPLMLEPQVPRFANEGDQLAMRATVRNASQLAGEWEISLSPNPPASEPIAVLAKKAKNSVRVKLDPGEATTVRFDVEFRNTGQAVMNWKAVPVSLAKQTPTGSQTLRHSDAVESTFQVEYPTPLLRQNLLIRMDQSSDQADLLKQLDADLLEGNGFLDVEISRSLLSEAEGAVDYLLSYPYGCLEQTTSSLLPWLAVERLRVASPGLAKKTPEEVQKAIQGGVARLLSMQNRDGGFGYWPDTHESSRWSSSYAGLGLILASKQTSVPQDSIDQLCKFLIKHLRRINEESTASELEISARDLWVLALAGKPQESYIDLLSKRPADLTLGARSFLALAQASAGDKQGARQWLTGKHPQPPTAETWMRWQPDDALLLLAWARVDRDAAETTNAFDKLLNDRNPYGHWRTTWMNSWSLMAIAAYAESEILTPTNFTLVTDGESETLTIGPNQAVISRRMPLHQGMQLGIKAEGQMMVRMKLAAKPKIAPLKPVSAQGMEITRFYERVKPDGSREPLGKPEVGDLVRVSLRVTLPEDDSRYIVVEDRLPSTFEAVNETFGSQATSMNNDATSQMDWSVSHNEVRADRVMFFMDRCYRKGTHTLTYHARVTLEGEAYAPPAKVEAMYDPDRLALSATRIFEVK